MAANDTYRSERQLTGPGDDAFAITPSDATDFTTVTRAIYCGSTGNIAVVMKGGTVVTFVGVPAGAILPVRASRVNSTNTTASSLVGLL